VKPITMYHCDHCKKVFKTPNRHNCKHDPAHKNCLTCGNLKSWDDFEGQYDYEGRCELPPYVYPECEFARTDEFESLFEEQVERAMRKGEQRYGFVNLLYFNKWKLDCPKWVERQEAK
jgi:hypothetical protein